MKTKAARVAELADEAGLDPDEALIMLWDAGLDDFDDPKDRIPKRYLVQAREAVGLLGRPRLKEPEYWERTLGLTSDKFSEVLTALDIRRPRGARILPKGSIRKLRKWAKQNGKLPEPAPAEITLARAPEAEPAFAWHRVGRHPHLATLSAQELESVHLQLVADFATGDDPIDPPGVRSQNLLESAVFRPQTAMGDQLKYPTGEMATAALVHSIVHDHPFHNGNKRTALVAMLVQLDRSNLTLTCSESDLFKLVLRLAQHRVVPLGPALPDREVAWCADWICANSRDVDKRERPMQWRRLRRILNDFGCEMTPAPGVGNRLNIRRSVKRTWVLGLPRSRVLQIQAHWKGDGTEADVATVKWIRNNLELDDDHGCDSAVFYRAAQETVAEGFILKYRKILKRLASL